MTFTPSRKPPHFINTRTALALPLIVLAVVLYALMATILFFVDWISGRPLSRDLLG